MLKLKNIRARHGWLVFAIAAFEASAFTLEAFMNSTVDMRAFVLAASVPALLIAQMALYKRFSHGADRTLLALTHFLCGMGLILQYRLDAATAMRQLVFYGIGIVLMQIAMLLITRRFPFDKLRWVLMGGTVAVLLLTAIFGRETYGAKNWLYIGGMSLQPSEAAKISLCAALAIYAARGRGRAAMLPAVAFAALCVGCLILQKDLGGSLVFFFTTITVYYAVTSDLLLTGAGALAGAGGAVLMYQLFDHVKVRVAIWVNPWATNDTTGYQIVQSLMAISTGGLLGMGLGLGTPRYIPAYFTDFVFAVICEEMGILMGLILLALYALLVIRGALIAVASRDRFHAALALGLTLLLGFQTVLIVGGVIKMIPLTGVTLPFISYGGSSLISSMVMVGLLEGIAVANREALEKEREAHA